MSAMKFVLSMHFSLLIFVSTFLQQCCLRLKDYKLNSNVFTVYYAAAMFVT